MDEQGGRITGSERPSTVLTAFTLTPGRTPLGTARAKQKRKLRPRQNSTHSQAYAHAPAQPGLREKPVQTTPDISDAGQRKTGGGRGQAHIQTNK